MISNQGNDPMIDRGQRKSFFSKDVRIDKMIIFKEKYYA